MTVLKGEGKHPILYSSTRLPTGGGPGAYLARPDAAGTHPTVIVAHSAAGITSHAKVACRRLARHGFAAICPDLSPRGSRPNREAAEPLGAAGGRPARVGLLDAYRTAAAAGTDWCDPERIGLMGIGEGAEAVLLAAPSIPNPSAVVLADLRVGASESELVTLLTGAGAPVFALVAMSAVGADVIETIRRGVPHSEWVGYPEMSPGFLDESAEEFDPEAAADGWGRVVAFLERVLAPS